MNNILIFKPLLKVFWNASQSIGSKECFIRHKLCNVTGNLNDMRAPQIVIQ